MAQHVGAATTVRLPRAERHAQVKALKEAGLTFKQIAAHLGIAFSTATDAYYDGTGAMARARKERARCPELPEPDVPVAPVKASWEAKAVGKLVALKRLGFTFEEARQQVERNPRARPAVEAPPLFVVPGEDYEEESAEDAFWRFCADAWHGRKPRLSEWTPDVLRDEIKGSAASKRGRMTAAA